jgi:hypothetical protein
MVLFTDIEVIIRHKTRENENNHPCSVKTYKLSFGYTYDR